ncbi:YbdK family carboxylate-amine ligase [Amycolatopsis halotolerans]|uniref:YbdK family carboxylate-amine ligase n=1 Tax=Amycolatopsis halotolerans TaxID=330083 RepID=A0ABV7QBP7_9PSEU
MWTWRCPQSAVCADVCRTRDEALRRLRELREDLAAAARRQQRRLLPAGTPPVAEAGLPSVTPNPRYERIAEHFGAIARTARTCGCHVHVAVPDKETGTQVLGRIRPWLPALLTVTANSAIADGYDTGYRSWRDQQWSRWPSAGPPPRFASLDEYESVVDAWLCSGAILDRGMVYWDVRLSEKQPTIEFRMADVAATPQEAVLLGWRASRDGVIGSCPHPSSGDLAPTKTVLTDLVELASSALEAAGDLEFAREAVTRLCAEGSGADRQRQRFAERGRGEDVVDLLAGTG